VSAPIGRMPRRYAAFLRGVSPMNAKMPELKRAFEAAGFADVVTLLSSGNVVFSAPPAAEATLERRAEAAMRTRLGNGFQAFVRPVDDLQRMIASDPYQGFRLAPGAKRIVTFLRANGTGEVELPIERDGARILCVREREVFSAYLPGPRGPVFMTLIERTFGKEVTTRTWDTIRKAASR
jgi:uncharacterized protein (DUF1697 family)